jgi:hypothetical protein
MWFSGPLPLPKSKFAFKAAVKYCLAALILALKLRPAAKLQAMALESVQPVPWVLGL